MLAHTLSGLVVRRCVLEVLLLCVSLGEHVNVELGSLFSQPPGLVLAEGEPECHSGHDHGDDCGEEGCDQRDDRFGMHAAKW